MPSVDRGSFSYQIAPDQVARVFMTTLNRLGWSSPYVDEGTCTITSRRNYDELKGTTTWHYKYSAVIRWNGDGQTSNISLEVTETAYQWTQNSCTKAIEEIATCFMQDANVLARTSGAGTGTQQSARWVTPRELELAEYVGPVDSPGKLLLTGNAPNFLRLPEAETNRHALVCGPTGSGKTTGIFIPNLIERVKASAIVTEATGGKGIAHLFSQTHSYRAANGHQIYYFNPDDLSSDRINPLDFVHTEADAKRITEIIMQSTTLQSHRGDQSWEMSERLLLSALIMHTVGERENGNCNMAYIAKLVQKGAKKIYEAMQKSQIEEARDQYQGFHENATEAYRNLVITGLLNRIGKWKEPRVKALTEATDIDFEKLPDELFTLYLAVPAEKPELKQVAAIILNLSLYFVMGHTFEHPVMLLLDELTNFGYVRGLHSKLTIIRHDKIPVILGVQDYAQLQLLYKDEHKLLISQPATKVYFKPQDLDTATGISKILGMAIQERVTSHGHLQRERQPLLSADELMNLGVIDERRMTVEDGKPHMIITLPRTRPAKVEALTWRDYVDELNPEKYPPLPRRVLEVEESLTRVKSNKDSAPGVSANFGLGKDRSDEELAVTQAADDVSNDPPAPVTVDGGDDDQLKWLYS